MSTAEAESHLRENPFELARVAAASSRRDLRPRSEPDSRPLAVQEGRRGLDPGRDGRRVDRGVPGLPRDAQHRARPVEGGHPLPPGRHARRGQVAVDVDDLEVRAHGTSVRRREGWRRLQPEDALRGRARADDAPLHERDHQRHRPRAGHPRAGRRHGRPGHGVDLRHLLDEQGVLRPRRRHRQAALGRRLARPRGGDRPRQPLLHPGPVDEAGTAPQRVLGRDPGLRERGLEPRANAPLRRREGRRRVGFAGRRLQRGRARHPRARSRTSRSTEYSPVSAMRMP